MDNKCVCCGAVIPEGRQVCPSCENKRTRPKKKIIYADDLFAILRDDINISGSNLAKVRRHIAETPAVDAVEVVHGKWEAVKYTRHCNCDKASNSIEEYLYKCSACNRVAYKQPYGLNYCPNCGAKMDGDGNV